MRVERVLVALLAIVATAGPSASCPSNNEKSDGGMGGTAKRRRDAVRRRGRRGAARPGTVRMAVPAYFDPPSAEWQRLIAGAPAIGMIVFNPESGPGAAADPAYTQVIAQAQAAGIVMVGYVATSYGARPEADVIADINRYYDFYSLSGIYFAEGPMENDCTAMEAMYHRMSDAVRARDSRAYLAVGTRFCPTYITFFDMMVQFARNWNEYQTDYAPPSWMPANSPQRFVHFVHSVPPGDASAALSRAVANGAGWVFITDQSRAEPVGRAAELLQRGARDHARHRVTASPSRRRSMRTIAGGDMSRLPETALLTALALIAFASNSILTRLGLGGGQMDAATFTTVRIAAGAIVLAGLVRIQHGPPVTKAGRGWVGPVALFAYAAPFSFAYVRIGAAAGALLLFGAVQITMIGRGIAAANAPGFAPGPASFWRPRAWRG